MNIGEIAEQLRRSTVQIHAPGRGGIGSGIALDAETILTNAHVVGDQREVGIEPWNGVGITATVRLSDPSCDLALVSSQVPHLPPVTLREEPPASGEAVLAIGNPMGFSGALTKGVVRGLGPVRRIGSRPWVQSMIRLAPGNSGGPLADLQGQVLGINTMIVGRGLALAVPGSEIRSFLLRARAPRLGITAQTVSGGLLILGIEPGGPADRASLLMGDLLTHWNGQPIRDAGDLLAGLQRSLGKGTVRFIRSGRPGREVTVVSSKDGVSGVAA